MKKWISKNIAQASHFLVAAALLVVTSLVVSCKKDDAKQASTTSGAASSIGPTKLSVSDSEPRAIIEGDDKSIIMIKGFGFNTDPNKNMVTIGDRVATVVDAGIDYLQVKVPAGLPANDYTITVVTNSQKNAAAFLFVLNKNDVNQVKAFFDQNIDGKSNGEKIVEAKITNFNPNNLTTWLSGSVTNFETNNGGRLIYFSLPKKIKLAGALNLKGCSKLEDVHVNNQDLTSIDLTGASENLKLSCKGNQLKSITLSHPLKDKSNINPQQAEHPDVVIIVK